MNPKQFLTIGGIVLLLIGILGFVGVIGPTSANSPFGTFWWFDNAENIAHTVLGIAGLVAAFTFPMLWQKYLTILLGVIALVVGLYSAMSAVPTGAELLGAQLQNPADTLLHLVVGAWALWAGFMGAGKK